MTKINKTDIENISLIKKEFKLKNISTIKVKKGNYEIEISSSTFNSHSMNIANTNKQEEIKVEKKDLSKPSLKNENVVKSPMVGVAYLSADPESPPFVKVGQHIKKGETLLLIEAMKTFNEVKAPISGIIKEINILNSQPVEFGDELVIFE